MSQAVSDVASNSQENIAHAAEVLGGSTHRVRIFDRIYTGKRKSKTVTELMKATKLPRTRVLDAGKKLADNKIVRQIKIDGETAYEKIDFFHAHKRKILSLAKSPEKLSQYPTKRNVKHATRTVQVRISAQRAKTTMISIDDIETFRRTRKIKSDGDLGDTLSETSFKDGIKRIIGEGGDFKDWGGEICDLYTTRLKVAGKRRSAALAFKGPAAKGKLTPGKMGKNGDQIQRLFEAPAEVFVVQYCRQIEQSVVTQMEKFAVHKSVFSGKQIWFGVIDGQDSSRLVQAYPNAFL